MAQASLFGDDPPTRFGNLAVREIGARSILTATHGSLKDYDYSLNPYVGCGFGCSYCYAAFFVPDDQRAATWGTWVDIKANALDLLRRSAGLAGSRIFMSSVTDPYQPIEAKLGLTRSLLEFMVDLRPQPRIVVQTRSDLPVRESDLLRRFEHLRVNISVTTDCETIRKRFEPACVSIPRRLEGLRKLNEAGIQTAACLCPLLPIKDPEAFARTLKATGTNRFSVSKFHETRARFAAGTRPLALELAQEYGWDDQAYEGTVRRLENILDFGGAFRPA